ncbi:MAG: ATP-grasp domain-containing protein, partial [Chloroflexota bacterium]|nr:ATP-grasp domain-containing protein [Chloroflexota bacterium]
MKVHEYQAKQLLAEFGIPIPHGGVAKTATEARDIAADLSGKAIVKAQVHAGGRGKAGGIKTASSPEEAEQLAKDLLGHRLVTHQTLPDGLPIKAVLIEEEISIERELYLGIVIDGAAGQPVIMASEAGGMEIEEVARTSPEKILKVHIDIALGVRPYQTRSMAYGLNLAPDQIRSVTGIISNLYRLFQAKDCSLAEINPLVITSDGRILAADAKLNFDDNALYRQNSITELRDIEQEDRLEVEAKNRGIENYIKLDGTIGC